MTAILAIVLTLASEPQTAGGGGAQTQTQSQTQTMGIRAVPQRYLWQAQTFGASRWFLLAHVMLPSALPFVLGGIKLGLAASWRSLIGAEMFAGVGAGLGLMLYDAQNFYATDVMFFALVLVAAASVAIEQLGLRALERRTVERWGMVGAAKA